VCCQIDILEANLKFPYIDEAVRDYSRVYSFVTNRCLILVREEMHAANTSEREAAQGQKYWLSGLHFKAGCALRPFCTRSVERNVAELSVAVGRAADHEPPKHRHKGWIPSRELCRQGRKPQTSASLLLTEDLGSHKGILGYDAV
jgi:hypothetical protein